MSEDRKMARRRRRRTEWLESSIVLILVVSIIASLGLCVFLTTRISKLNNSIDGLVEQIEWLTEMAESQQEQLEALISHKLPDTNNGQDTEKNVNVDKDALVETEDTKVPEKTDSDVRIEDYQGMNKVYLTFDDGPSKYTPQILDILDQYNVKATFFVVGKESDSAKAYMKDIVERGHTLGMHSYSHKYAEIYSSVESFAADFDKQQQYLYQLTGEACMIYRFPGGSSNEVSPIPMSEFARYLAGRGVTFYDWNIVSGDGATELLSVEQLVANSITGIGREESSIILLHDSADKSTTVDALPQIIENILALENTVILPITEETVPVQHIQWTVDETADQTKE